MQGASAEGLDRVFRNGFAVGSPHTVANQVQAIFGAFGARSRGDLLARLNDRYKTSSVAY